MSLSKFFKQYKDKDLLPIKDVNVALNNDVTNKVSKISDSILDSFKDSQMQNSPWLDAWVSGWVSYSQTPEVKDEEKQDNMITPGLKM